MIEKSISEENGLKLIKNEDINILSIGVSTCGTAEIRMLDNNKNRKVIATTIDKEGLEITKKIIDDLNLSNSIELKYEDISKKMPYEDESFDFIYARLVLHYLNDNELDIALKELNRVLKTNKLMYVVVRSLKGWEAALEGTTYDSEIGMTRYPKYRTLGTDNVEYFCRRLHSTSSISDSLTNNNFKIEKILEYKEQLFGDYLRKDKMPFEDVLIEITVSK
jgi:Methylase involved in ubiquinone/menaquinone biosynthesis